MIDRATSRALDLASVPLCLAARTWAWRSAILASSPFALCKISPFLHGTNQWDSIESAGATQNDILEKSARKQRKRRILHCNGGYEAILMRVLNMHTQPSATRENARGSDGADLSTCTVRTSWAQHVFSERLQPYLWPRHAASPSSIHPHTVETASHISTASGKSLHVYECPSSTELEQQSIPC